MRSAIWYFDFVSPFAYGRGMGGRWQRVVLWVSAPVTVLIWIVPYFKG